MGRWEEPWSHIYYSAEMSDLTVGDMGWTADSDWTAVVLSSLTASLVCSGCIDSTTPLWAALYLFSRNSAFHQLSL